MRELEARPWRVPSTVAPLAAQLSTPSTATRVLQHDELSPASSPITTFCTQGLQPPSLTVSLLLAASTRVWWDAHCG
jgi:hypothetical protein